MKKLCYFSLIIGIGIGMIITASLNELVGGNDQEIPQVVDNSSQGELEKTLGEIKNSLIVQQSQLDQIEGDLENEPEKMENDELYPSDGDKIEDTKPQEPVEITILPGMHTQAIADLMAEKGLIESPEDFIEEAYAKDVTRKFRAGKVLIPRGSSIEDIFELLTKRP
ncbi:hypothetical protein JCM11672_34790 [Alkaliphilus crotonatoxidans]